MRPTVIVAERNRRMCELYARSLNWHGFSAETAANGDECLAKIRALRPDVLIFDLDVPWAGATRVIDVLCEAGEPFASLNVLVTGSQPEVVLSERTGVPRRHCFQRPVPLEDVIAALAEIPATRRD